MLGILLTRAASSEAQFDQFSLMKCYNTTKGCSAEEIVTFLGFGSLSPEEINNITTVLKELLIHVYDPEFNLAEFAENEEVQRYTKYVKELSLKKNLFEVIADGNMTTLNTLKESYSQMIKDTKSFARIASTSLISEKQILKMLEKYPQSPDDITVEFYINYSKVSPEFYEKVRIQIVNVLDQHQSVYRALSNLTGIKFETISNYINSIRQMVIEDCYNVNNVEKILENLSKLIDEASQQELPDIFIDQEITFNLTEMIINIPHLQVVTESILQLCNSFEKNSKEWVRLTGYVLPKEEIDDIRHAVNKINNGFSLNDILLEIYGEQEIVNQLLDNLKFFYSAETTPEKILSRFLSKEIFDQYRKFMNIVVNENSTIIQLATYIESLFGYAKPVHFNALIQALTELGNENQDLTKLSILQGYDVNEFVRDLQKNISEIYTRKIGLIEEGIITQEDIDSIISMLESEPTFQSVLEMLNLSDIAETFIMVYSSIHDNITKLIETVPDEEIKLILNNTLTYMDLIVNEFNEIIESNQTIRQFIESLPIENASLIYPYIIESIASLNESTCIKDKVLEIDADYPLPFSIDAAINGLCEMKDITILNIARLFVEDDLQQIKDTLKDISTFAANLGNMKVTDFFYAAFGISQSDIEKVYVTINQFLQFQYVKYLNSTSEAASKFFGTINDFIANPNKKYNVNDIDKALDGFISMATGVERPAYKTEGTKSNVGLIIGLTLLGVALVVACAIGLVIYRKKQRFIDEESTLDATMV